MEKSTWSNILTIDKHEILPKCKILPICDSILLKGYGDNGVVNVTLVCLVCSEHDGELRMSVQNHLVTLPTSKLEPTWMS